MHSAEKAQGIGRTFEDLGWQKKQQNFNSGPAALV
jgi:hypothetical protein